MRVNGRLIWEPVAGFRCFRQRLLTFVFRSPMLYRRGFTETERRATHCRVHHCRRSVARRADSAFPEAQVRCLGIGTIGKACSTGIKPQSLTTVCPSAAAAVVLLVRLLRSVVRHRRGGGGGGVVVCACALIAKMSDLKDRLLTAPLVARLEMKDPQR